MRAASVDRSERLQRVVKFISDGKEHSTLDVVNGAQVVAVNPAMAELRQQGYVIDCERRGDKWFYRMRIDKASLSQAVGL